MTPHRLILAVSAALLVVLPLGGGAMGATSFGANGDIAYVRAGSIAFQSSTAPIAGATDPSWSPDGTKLAFSRLTQIQTCDVAGCTPVQVGGATGTQPAWSPSVSSPQIAYVTGGQIHVINADGSGDVAVTTTGTNADPSWSPNGSQLVFTRNGVIVTSAPTAGAGESAVAVNTGLASSSQPAWSPDGVSFAFQSSVSGTSHIYVTTGSGTSTPVTSGSAGETAPSWSPDSNSIVYADAASGISTVTRIGSTFQPGTTFGLAGDGTPDWQTVAPIAVQPTINGGASPVTGQVLSVGNNGSWTGATSFTYQWARCNSSGASCVNVATTTTYTVTSSDVGSTIRVTVTGTNDAGSTTSQQSDPTGVVTQAGTVTPPSNTAYPVVNLGFNQSAPLIGTTVTASNGTWTGTFPMTFTYQWKRCDGKFGPCFAITGAKSSFFTVGAAQYGFALRVEVTATNSAGSVSQNSEATPLVTAVAPFLRVTPQITTTRPTVDQPLSLSSGTWDGTPAPTFTYSWRRCNAPGDVASCVQIAGATLATYTPKVDDIGSTIRVWITGTNQAGSALAITNHTFPVIDKAHFAPRAVSSPSISGTVAVGRQLTASTGSYDGDDPLTSVFVWQRCDATGASCKTIPGKPKMTYNPTKVDIGFTLRLSVTVTNAYGKLVSMSDPTEPVATPQPHKKGRRIIGKPGNDYIAGGGFDDVILGMGGSDTILGGAGDDKLDGGPGNDIVTGGSGADQLFGGAGSDTIYAADGERDVIDCGDGRDRAVVDSVDKVNKNCEVVQTGASTPTPTPTTPGETTPGETTPGAATLPRRP